MSATEDERPIVILRARQKAPVYPDFEAMKRSIRRSRNLKPIHRMNSVVATNVRDDMQLRGQLYKTALNQSYVFLRDTGALIKLEKGNDILELELRKYGLNPTEPTCKYVIEELRLAALDIGKEVTIYKLSHYERVTQSVYISDFDSGMYKITVDDIKHVNNGTDGVMFERDPRWIPLELTAGEVLPGGNWLESLLHGLTFREGHLSAIDQVVLLKSSIMSMFFSDFMATRPITAAIGEKGSGKSAMWRRLGRFLFGRNFDLMPLTSKSDEFDVAVTNEALVVADNVDEDPPPWFADRLAFVATGGKIMRRQLYTTNKSIQYDITASVGITSRTPHYRRDDIADRLVPVYLGRIDHGFASESAATALHAANRSDAMRHALADVQRVLRKIAEGALPARSPIRLGDFGLFTIAVCQALHPEIDGEALLRRLADEQAAFAAGGNQTIEDGADATERLVELVKIFVGRVHNGQCSNSGREMTAKELIDELRSIAVECGVPSPYPDARSLSSKLSKAIRSMECHFKITRRFGHGGYTYWSFEPVASAA